jgi:cell division protein FtsB
MAFMTPLLLKHYLHQCDAKIAAFWRSVKEILHRSNSSEEVARRDLGLVRPGETVYQFRKR